MQIDRPADSKEKEATMLTKLVSALLLTIAISAGASARAGEPAAGPAGEQPRRVLIVTGQDYKGHVWQKTTPVLKQQIEKDPRLSVEVLDDLKKLPDTDLTGYAAVVVHFKNYDANVPGRAGLDNLIRYTRGGGGLVLVHFACGAFQEYRDDFAKLVGRAWNPKLRPHDPRGPFEVRIDDANHPVTAGMKPFTITDELYTCLDGNAPIHVLASAVSKVDKKVYPMAFILDCGKGRVFHCVLGHDVEALGCDGAGLLYRRGTAWAARLDLPAAAAAAGNAAKADDDPLPNKGTPQ